MTRVCYTDPATPYAMSISTTHNSTGRIEELFRVGAHYAYRRSQRHPTTAGFIFGIKNNVEIFDLEKTKLCLEAAETFVKKLGSEKKTILFVCGKSEGRAAILNSAESIGMPYVAGRWVGGTFTNFSQIRRQVDALLLLREKRGRGEFAPYTKKERLLIDRQIARGESLFSGLISLKALPDALFVIDPRGEVNAVAEARKLRIPIVALLNSDCNVKLVNYPIPGNDASQASIRFFVETIVRAYKEGLGAADAETALSEHGNQGTNQNPAR